MKKYGSLLILGALASHWQACSSEEQSKIKSICGSNELQEIADYDGSFALNRSEVESIQNSIGALGKVNDDDYFCTGGLISKKHFLTARHCLDSVLASDLRVAFNYQKDIDGILLEVKHYQVSKVIENGINGVDYAVLELSADDAGELPGDQFGHLNLDFRSLHTSEELVIIQHPHGEPKQIHGGELTRISDYRIHYKIDTKSNSSGSPVLDSSGNIVAIHVEGGCEEFNGENGAVALEKVYSVSPFFNEDLEEKQPVRARNLPATIPDGDNAGIFHRKNNGQIWNKIETVRVSVDISHSYVEDLELILESPMGTKVVLYKNQAGARNLVGSFPGDFQTYESLDAFIGEYSRGDWKLYVRDTINLVSGKLNDWSIEFNKDSVPDDDTDKPSVPVVVNGVKKVSISSENDHNLILSPLFLAPSSEGNSKGVIRVQHDANMGAVCLVKIRYSYLDNNGNTLETGETYLNSNKVYEWSGFNNPTCLDKGDFGYFLLAETNNQTQIHSVKATIHTRNFGIDTLKPLNASTTLLNLRENSGRYLLDVRNDGPSSVYVDKPVIVLFDEDSQPIFWDDASLSSSELEPDAVLEAEISYNGPLTVRTMTFLSNL